jgi:hypothetical protein
MRCVHAQVPPALAGLAETAHRHHDAATAAALAADVRRERSEACAAEAASAIADEVGLARTHAEAAASVRACAHRTHKHARVRAP